MNLYVGNLAYWATEADLRQLFAAAGAVQSARIVYDRDTGRSRGFGFVEMANRAAGESAIEAVNGSNFQGRKLRVSEASS